MSRQNNILTLAPYLGGKGRLVPVLTELIARTPDASLYGELFGGMGSVLLNKAPHPHEIYNELSPSNYSIFKCLSTPELAEPYIKAIFESNYDEEIYRKYRSLYDTKFAPTINRFQQTREAKQAQAEFNLWLEANVLELGITSLILVRMSFSGLIRHKSPLRFKDGTEGQTYENWKFRLSSVAERLAGVEVVNRDAMDIIREHSDDPHAVFLCDPPYYGDQRSGGIKDGTENKDYTEDWTKETHEQFLKTVRDVKCKLIICNYQSDDKLYDHALLGFGWHRLFVGELTKNAKNNGIGAMRDRVKEWVWINYEV